jgi:hypothetical protein
VIYHLGYSRESGRSGIRRGLPARQTLRMSTTQEREPKKISWSELYWEAGALVGCALGTVLHVTARDGGFGDSMLAQWYWRLAAVVAVVGVLEVILHATDPGRFFRR